MARSREAKLSPRRVKSKLRAVQATELRCSGLTFPQIAQQLGYKSPQATYAAVKRTLDAAINQAAEEERKVDLLRLEKAIWSIWPKVIIGDIPAGSLLDRHLERRAKLLGLDAPTQVKVDLYAIVRRMAEAEGLDPEEAIREAETILQRAK